MSICRLKDLWVAAIFPPVNTSLEAVPSSHNFNVRDEDKPQWWFCAKNNAQVKLIFSSQNQSNQLSIQQKSIGAIVSPYAAQQGNTVQRNTMKEFSTKKSIILKIPTCFANSDCLKFILPGCIFTQNVDCWFCAPSLTLTSCPVWTGRLIPQRTISFSKHTLHVSILSIY